MSAIHSADIIHNSIIQDLSEGILSFDLDGRVSIVNPAAEAILGIPREELQGQRYGKLLFRFQENDSFNQAILDAVYDRQSKHKNVVPYFDGHVEKTLHVTSSFLHRGEERVGIIVVLSDLTDIVEMGRRHVREINALTESLVKTLSVTIDERSHYTARHTQNMVLMGEAFLDWLRQTGSVWFFDDDRRRELLMSIWLHDVGKIAIPLEIMDKATRLGPKLHDIEVRFDRIALLNRIALLEGRMTRAEYDAAEADREGTLDFIHKINVRGFATDGELQMIKDLGARVYIEADGQETPLFSTGEIEALSIRRGTLTAGERQTMQSHATLTRKILEQVSFPSEYAEIPFWASAHHELLNGRGYPAGLAGRAIPREVQLITILDIFEALTARDRPYKPPIPLEKTWAIMEDMAREGSINGDLLQQFRESGAWRKIPELTQE